MDRIILLVSRKLFFFVKAGFLAWVMNILLLFALLYGRSDLAFVGRLIFARGFFLVGFVAFPLITLCFSYFFSSLGFLLFNSK